MRNERLNKDVKGVLITSTWVEKVRVREEKMDDKALCSLFFEHSPLRTNSK